MGTAAYALMAIAIAACGRINFNPLGGDGAESDVRCTTLVQTCGPSGSSSCCESIVVPAGTFYRSYDGVGFNDIGNPATVSAFRLDKYEVTVGRFREFVDAGRGTQQNPPLANAGARTLNGVAGQGGWDATWDVNLAADTTALRGALTCDATFRTWTDAVGGNESRPMNCTDWYVAMAFCIWDGGFLPTDAQWNYAAAGGNLQRAFPWSNPAGDLTIDGSYASYNDGTNCVGDGLAGCALTDLVNVGSKPAGVGVWGHSDLSGNVWEWILDYYSPQFPLPCDDCANLTAAVHRTGRGGGWGNAVSTQRVGYHGNNDPLARFNSVGFRCARPL